MLILEGLNIVSVWFFILFLGLYIRPKVKGLSTFHPHNSLTH